MTLKISLINLDLPFNEPHIATLGVAIIQIVGVCMYHLVVVRS